MRVWKEMRDFINTIKENKLPISLVIALLIFAWIPQISNSANKSLYDEILVHLGYQWYLFTGYVVLVLISMRMTITLVIKRIFKSSIKNTLFTILGVFILSFILQFFISNRILLDKFYEVISEPDPFIRSIVTTYCIIYDSINEFINLLKKRKEQ
ncbi:hypothetical protein V6W75_08045 [Mannheimia sp. HC-2023]|uniref:hypothetical protein n=1 Tax=Mannheimia indoligenes TaxID=3103145 RepID=UPI002FE5AB2C